MIATDEDALICDLAETYHIYDYKSLPVKTVATFSCGLGQDSRIKMKMRGETRTTRELLLAIIADDLNALVWMRTEDGRKGINKPPSIFASMMENTDDKEKEFQVFDSAEAFEKARRTAIEGGNENE